MTAESNVGVSAVPTEGTDKSTALRLLLVSSAALYLEIILIRWIGTEVRIFAFFQNLSLIACFLGFGLGCFNTKQRGSLLPSLLAVTALVVMVNLPFQTWHNVLIMMSAALSFTPDAALWGANLTLSDSDTAAPVGQVSIFGLTHPASPFSRSNAPQPWPYW